MEPNTEAKTATPATDAAHRPAFDQKNYQDGKYYWTGRAKSWGHGKAGKGTQQLIVAFSGLTPAGESFELERAFYFTSATASRTLEALEAMGVAIDDPAAIPAIVHELLGGGGDLSKNEVKLTIEIGEKEVGEADDKGVRPKMRVTEIAWVNRLGRFTRVAATGEDEMVISQALQAAFMNRKSSMPGATRAPTMPTAAPVSGNGVNFPPKPDDDLPF